MAKKNFLLLSLKDPKTKKIANIVSNESCRKILDYLSEEEAAESQIAKALGIPISTVHYNLAQLTDAGLLIAEEFHYSEKGKEVYHYKLANKYIVIAPKKISGVREKLMGILPAAIIAIGTAGFIHLFANYLNFSEGPPQILAAKSEMMRQEAIEMAADSAAIQATSEPNVALWFLAGSLFALLAYVAVSIIRKESRE